MIDQAERVDRAYITVAVVGWLSGSLMRALCSLAIRRWQETSFAHGVDQHVHIWKHAALCEQECHNLTRAIGAALVVAGVHCYTRVGQLENIAVLQPHCRAEARNCARQLLYIVCRAHWQVNKLKTFRDTDETSSLPI